MVYAANGLKCVTSRCRSVMSGLSGLTSSLRSITSCLRNGISDSCSVLSAVRNLMNNFSVENLGASAHLEQEGILKQTRTRKIHVRYEYLSSPLSLSLSLSPSSVQFRPQ